MRNLASWLLAILVATVVSGCSFHHSIPYADSFVEPPRQNCESETATQCLSGNRFQIFVDANGTFYPNGWQSVLPHVRPTRRWREHSLLMEARNNSALGVLLEAEQTRQLDDVAQFNETEGRIFILVHGFANSHEDAAAGYVEVERLLDIQDGDRIIRFYWDGLVSDNLGATRIWFWATGNSQVAGSRGLRRVLAQFRDKDIYLISHSRGASVILSALSNPPYDPDFRRRTMAFASSWDENFLNPDALVENGNRIDVLMFAPAIDRIDFCESDYQLNNQNAYYCPHENLRSLGDQLQSIRYSVNEADWVLNKFGFGDSFNPTELGQNPNAGDDISHHYPNFRKFIFEPFSAHDFLSYISQPDFITMLSHASIARQD